MLADALPLPPATPELLRTTALPALAMLAALPLWWLIPARGARTFFQVSGGFFVLTIGQAQGPALLAGVLAVGLFTHRYADFAAAQPHSPMRFRFGLAALHALYLSVFLLPAPAAFVAAYPYQPAAAAPIFVLFSGVAGTFMRCTAYYFDRCRDPLNRVGLSDFYAYLLYFPQFRHGPIERCRPFVEQLRNARTGWNRDHVKHGLRRIAFGLSLLLGVGLVAGVVHQVRGPLQLSDIDPRNWSWGELLLVIHGVPAVLYVVGVAYAEVQLGVSRVFGVVGSENFYYTFLARGPREFWQRWNITFAHWLRDYAFYPLGGRRRRYIAITLTFVYCGLLHGPQWRCFVWGLYIGMTMACALLVSESWSRWTRKRRRARRGIADGARGSATPRWVLLIRDNLQRLLTWHWLGWSVVILMDDQTSGWMVARRALQLIGLVEE